VAMLVTGWVSSRIGAKRTLVIGLVLIVVFSALAGMSSTIGQIVGFRAGWGLGNALFIATSLAVIVGSASGGFAGAIVLYEAALGIGIASGPILGGVLGNISWRGPFFGVSILMAIALIATVLLVPKSKVPPRDQRSSFREPIVALKHRALAITSVMGLLYNWGFFTMLGYSPFLMHLSPLKLGAVFCAWGVLVAIFAVFAAPWTKSRFGTPDVLYVSFGLMAIDLMLIALFPQHRWVVIGAVIASGAMIGINNTLVTTAVMSIAPVPRPVASATYGFVRFIGGGLAPFAAAKLVEHYNVHVPFVIAAATLVAAGVMLALVHSQIAAADEDEAAVGPSHERTDAEVAVTQVPADPEEAIMAAEALAIDARQSAEARS
jgi:MFS transporter, ACDE family, multidrug resistance protein